MNALIEIKDLFVEFKNNNKIIYAVNGVSFSVRNNELFGIVGESGCGKSVTCKTILQLNKSPNQSGEVLFKGKNILQLTEENLQNIRGKEICMIFQDVKSSLNPMITIGKQITEVIKLHQKLSDVDANNIAIQTLKQLDIPDARNKMKEYPHQQSSGTNQRILIAIALCCNPQLIIADEPTSSLDVTIQNQILQIFKSLKSKLSIVIVSHDLSVIRETTDRLLILYKGIVMEEGNTEDIFITPLHPYTEALLASIPFTREKRIVLKGEPPSSMIKPNGCPFSSRCPYIIGEICKSELPQMFNLKNRVRCHLYGKIEYLLIHNRPIKEIREIIHSNQDYYIDELINIICNKSSKYRFDTISLSRCFLKHERRTFLSKVLSDICFDENESIGIRIKAVYESLEFREQQSNELLFVNFIVNNLDEYKNYIENKYTREFNYSKDGLFDFFKKEIVSSVRSSWIHFFELYVMFKNKPEAKEIFKSYLLPNNPAYQPITKLINNLKIW